MAFALAQTKFLGVIDLKYGVWIYGSLMLLFSLYFIVVPQLTLQDWIAFVGITSPASALLVLQVIWPDKFAYAWANWYFSFLAYILGTLYIIMQTFLILKLKSEIGVGQIRFRMSEAGNPLSPQLVSDAHLSESSAEFVRQGLAALPKRYFDFQALYHENATEFEWENGEAVATTTASMLNLQLWLDWFFFLFFGYFTLINYSHFNEAKKWTDFTSQTWSLSK
eukprot:CAMPEP_0170458208 /NCGR_PEP_ID=MMETSP0123-20130129/5242_1 /TAXON_ID=182087 /ORGANISM="Favella ehrenbergii, Strain Fehren 1" /LENGTH=222 /DNA_ID=CAMNT_0010722255 /DNA_START=22 /DNA_END=690 /DNA_ORIENTATION=-